MLSGFEKATYVGVIFDMDDFTLNGKSALKQIKEMLISFAAKIGMNAKIFVAGNENLPKSYGESMAQIDSYSMSRDNNPFSKKIIDCISGIGNQEDCNKLILILTNKFSDKDVFCYKKCFMINERKEYNCLINVFEVRRQNEKLLNLIEENQQKYFFLNDLTLFKTTLDEILMEIGYG
jgi:hypothetical protein